MSYISRSLIAALVISGLLHSLLFLLPSAKTEESLSDRSVLHARLSDKVKELAQQEQTGQIATADQETISQPEANSTPAESADAVKDLAQETPPPPIKDPVQSSTETSDIKTQIQEEEPDNNTPEPVTETPVEELAENSAEPVPQQAQPESNQQTHQVSQAQVEAIEGSDDPTYVSYVRVLTDYLQQRLKADPEFKGEVRLKIRIQYSSVVTSVKLIESSGNPSLDQWAVKAVLSANPFPSVPSELGDTFEYAPTLSF